jgi:hypothetical protein
MREYTRRPKEKPFPFHVWLAQTGLASVIILLLMSAKKLLLAQENCSENKFAHNEQIYCEQKFAQ